MKTTHGKTHSENGEGECWWSRIASPYPDANNTLTIFCICWLPHVLHSCLNPTRCLEG